MGKNHGGPMGPPTFLLQQLPADPSYMGILVVGDGYRKQDLAKFDANCAQLIAAIKSQPWFASNAATIRLNVAQQRVWSKEKAPTWCGKTKLTYFDATFGSSGLCRVLTGTSNLVSALSSGVATTLGVGAHYFNTVVVLVQSNRYGGAAVPGVMPSPTILWVSTARNEWTDVFLHELGHAMGLRDEYDYYTACDDSFVQGQGNPQALNVDRDGGHPKWFAAATTTDLPTTENPKKKTCDKRWFRSHVANNTVGAFEGANRYHSGFYRPQFTCKMRRASSDFCVVCQEALVDWLT